MKIYSHKLNASSDAILYVSHCKLILNRVHHLNNSNVCEDLLKSIRSIVITNIFSISL